MKSPSECRKILAALEAQHPGATTALTFRTPWELLAATILSAQTTDQRVNAVTPALFARFPDTAALAQADTGEVEALVRPTGFFRQKARTLVRVAQALVDRHGSEVPADMAALVQLPGVGRKTANVVLGHALGVPGFAVDRHVQRVTNRIGLADSPDPDVIEQQVTRSLPADTWTRASATLILHGRRICRPRPLCDRCAVRTACDYAAGRGPGRPRPPRGAARPSGTSRGRGAPARRPTARPPRGRR
jgi:endonuclease-3